MDKIKDEFADIPIVLEQLLKVLEGRTTYFSDLVIERLKIKVESVKLDAIMSS